VVGEGGLDLGRGIGRRALAPSDAPRLPRGRALSFAPDPPRNNCSRRFGLCIVFGGTLAPFPHCSVIFLPESLTAAEVFYESGWWLNSGGGEGDGVWVVNKFIHRGVSAIGLGSVI